MKTFFIRRILSVFLIFCVICSCLVIPVSAALSDATDIISSEAWDYITMGSWRRAIDAYFNGSATEDHGPYWSSSYWGKNNHVLVTESSLDSLALKFNTQYKDDFEYTITKAPFSDTGYYGLRITGASNNSFALCWLADNASRVILAEPDDETELGFWIPIRQLSNPYQMVTRETLTNLARDVGGVVRQSQDKYFIQNSAGTQIYVNRSGYPFAAWSNDSQTAINQSRPDTSVKDENGDPAVDENGNVIQDITNDNSTNIDLSGMTVTLPNGSVNLIDQLIYDESTKTYYIDSHDSYETNVYYHYSWTYHINYTSITYIGQSQEYNKYYEVYYELPDGRDSADLSAEELEQLNVSMDVVPYGRSADDTSLRSLYHFDGDTTDSSYWNYCTDFSWVSGASLTYLESGNFDGCLYLDENYHEFVLTLPSNLEMGDFTLQWRYYQSHTPAPVWDSSVFIGETRVMRFTGSKMQFGGGTDLCTIPTGTWNEIALVRQDGKFYYYLNGVFIDSCTMTEYLNNQLRFVFGSEQQTYKYIDELRVLNYALYKNGKNYTPTSVPYDTNLTLVLPDSSTPVADEYWDIQFNSDSRLKYNWTDNATYSGRKDYLTLQTSADGIIATPDVSKAAAFSNWQKVQAGTYSPYYTWNKIVVDFPNDDLINASYHQYYPIVGSVVVDGQVYSVAGSYMSPTNDEEVGEYYPTISEDSKSCLKRYTSFPGGLITFAGDSFIIGIDPNVTDVTITAVDVYVGPSSGGKDAALNAADRFENQLSAEKITSIIGLDPDNFNSPTLAVRTDVDITSYQIGGVRPSIPSEGLVWALVEGGYITSIQIYNGQAWEGCDGRIWTGERWIPYSSYNIITLQDMYDIVDATPNYEYIYTEAGFWSWWQKSWNSFVDRFFASGGSSGSIAPSTVKQTLSNALSSMITGLFTMITEVLKSLIGAASDLVTGISAFFTDTVLGGIKDFFSVFTDGSLFGFFQQEAEDGSVTVGLPSGLASAFAFISGVILVLPEDLRNLMFFGIGAMLLFAVLKLVKS